MSEPDETDRSPSRSNFILGLLLVTYVVVIGLATALLTGVLRPGWPL